VLTSQFDRTPSTCPSSSRTSRLKGSGWRAHINGFAKYFLLFLHSKRSRRAQNQELTWQMTLEKITSMEVNRIQATLGSKSCSGLIGITIHKQISRGFVIHRKIAILYSSPNLPSKYRSLESLPSISKPSFLYT